MSEVKKEVIESEDHFISPKMNAKMTMKCERLESANADFDPVTNIKHEAPIEFFLYVPPNEDRRENQKAQSKLLDVKRVCKLRLPRMNCWRLKPKYNDVIQLCDKCPECFNRPWALNRHLIRNVIRVFECDYCPHRCLETEMRNLLKKFALLQNEISFESPS